MEQTFRVEFSEKTQQYFINPDHTEPNRKDFLTIVVHASKKEFRLLAKYAMAVNGNTKPLKVEFIKQCLKDIKEYSIAEIEEMTGNIPPQRL